MTGWHPVANHRVRPGALYRYRTSSGPSCGVIGEHLRDHPRDPPSGRQVQEFVWAVRVRMRSEDAGDDKLRLWKFLAEHRHERDAAALAHIGRRRAERALRG